MPTIVQPGSSARAVFVRLKGGIGNQLFQYAYALSLAGGNPANVCCVLDFFRKDQRHGGFALIQLLGEQIQTQENPPADRRCVYVDADALADEDLSALRNTAFNLFIDGYFQNTRNFLPVLGQLESMYSSQFDQESYSRELRNLAGVTAGECLVAIHIRRRDFLDPKVRRWHGIPRPESIVACLDQVSSRRCTAVVFSDSKVSIELPCRRIDITRGENSLPANDIDHLRLMSCCNLLIASNSTYSYWAGLLSKHVEQIFIPDPWMRSGRVKTQSLLTDRIRAYPTELL